MPIDLPQMAALPAIDELFESAGPKACCAAVYEHPAVRWLLGGELHPGGEETTLRALELAGVRAEDRLLDVASGSGASALLAAERLGCEVVGIEYGSEAVRAASAEAEARGLADRVKFVQGDAEWLPFAEAEFDAVLCECSLCTFPAKQVAVAEMRRVLRDDGRLALADVIADHDRLPDALAGPLALIACVGDALPATGYESLLKGAGFRVTAVEPRLADAGRMAERVRDRLRGARLVGLDRLEGSPIDTAGAIELAGLAREAIDAGALGYVIFAARA